MKTVITKRAVIIGIIIMIYIAAVPLTLYFSGAFIRAELPDLKRLTGGFDTRYAVKTDEEKREILSDIGFDLQAFAASGFIFSIDNIRIYVYENEPERFCFLSMEITDFETYYITLSIYSSEADKQFHHYFPRYERQEINGKPVGFYEPNSDDNKSVARYRDTQTGYVYYVEPLLGFTETDYEFLSILTSNR